MNLQIIFTHLEATDALKNKIEQKANKFEKFFNRNFEVKWTCSVEKDEHTSHVIISGDGLTINAKATQDNLYKTFDDVVSKLEKQLSKKKHIRNDHIHHHDGTEKMMRGEI